MKNQRGEAYIWIMIAISVAVVGLVVVASWAAESYSCGKRADMMGLRSSWGPLQGCMVQVGPRYAPIGYIRIVDEKVIIQGDGE